MITSHKILIGVIFLSWSLAGFSQQQTPVAKNGPVARDSAPQPSEQEDSVKPSYEHAAESVLQKLDESISELNELREQIANETIPLSQKLNNLEGELATLRRDYQETTRLLDSRTLDLSNLRSEIKSRKEESTYLSNLLGEYTRNFESRLHIAELRRYSQALEEAKLAAENTNLPQQEVFENQARLLSASLDRLQDALGGTRFDGTASDSTGSIHHGTFVVIGPIALFQSDDGLNIGMAEQRLGSLEPTIIEFGNPADAQAALGVISESGGMLPLDPTLGNAHKIEETNETFMDEFYKGGVVMYAIFGLAAAAFLVAAFKFLCMLFVRTPSQKKINGLLKAIAENDEALSIAKSKVIVGPIGKMLRAGVEHIREPRELIEEVMYEKVLAVRLKLDQFLPFIAISAASAPLLGLLGTVTGIINTFKLLTVFGSGDVKSLSGGISEALITTKWGLIVAIPSLLVHAFLSRKARSIINKMEKAAVALVNQISKSDFNNDSKQTTYHPDPVNQPAPGYPDDSAGRIMNTQVFSVDKNSTIAEVINKMRSTPMDDDVDAVYIVEENGKYWGHVLIHHLFKGSDQAPIESVADKTPLYVRVDTPKKDIQNMFNQHRLINVPVIDREGLLVGRVARNGNGNGS